MAARGHPGSSDDPPPSGPFRRMVETVARGVRRAFRVIREVLELLDVLALLVRVVSAPFRLVARLLGHSLW